MGIAVKRDTDRRMPQQLTHYFDVDALFQQQRSGGMAQIVKANLGQSRFLEQRPGLTTRFLSLYAPNVQAVTERNQVDFAEMVDQPTALYLSIPSSASERLRPLSACLLMQMFATWIRLAETNGG